MTMAMRRGCGVVVTLDFGGGACFTGHADAMEHGDDSGRSFTISPQGTFAFSYFVRLKMTPGHSLEDQMCLAHFMGDKAAAKALADRIANGEAG
jgi:hypothetical protein